MWRIPPRATGYAPSDRTLLPYGWGKRVHHFYGSQVANLVFYKKNEYQIRHLDYIGQFTTDIQHVSGYDDIITDASSRAQSITDYAKLAEEELKMLQKGNTWLRLKEFQVPGVSFKQWCDVSTGTIRPYIAQPFQETVFNSLYYLSHKETNTTIKLVTQRYVWPSIKTNCRNWTRGCSNCQR